MAKGTSIPELLTFILFLEAILKVDSARFAILKFFVDANSKMESGYTHKFLIDDERDLPWVRLLAIGSYEQVWHIDAVRVVILAEAEASSCRQPRNILRTGTTLDVVGACDELRLSHVNRDLDVLALRRWFGCGHIFKLYKH